LYFRVAGPGIHEYRLGDLGNAVQHDEPAELLAGDADPGGRLDRPGRDHERAPGGTHPIGAVLEPAVREPICPPAADAGDREPDREPGRADMGERRADDERREQRRSRDR
jgi:hypothetical protein